MAWYLYSIFSAIGFGAIVLLITYLSRQQMTNLAVNTWFWASTALFFICISLVTSAKQLKVPVQNIKWFLLLAVIATATNILSVKALQTGPNSGIVRSVQMSQIIIATLGGMYFFHEGITLKAGIGIAFIIVGVILLVNK